MSIEIFCTVFNPIFTLLLSCMSSCIFWILASYQVYNLQFFSFSRFPSHPIILIVSFSVQCLYSLMQPHLFILAFVSFVFGIRFTKSSNIYKVKTMWLDKQHLPKQML